jgi:DNA-binding response OmpR family regulator
MNKNIPAASKILLVEDEDSLAIGLEYNLSEEGYVVDRAADGKQALAYIKTKEYDLIVLDIMLPYVDGFELAKLIRERFPQMPILMLTARTGIKDRIKGLELGADDYLTKPFHLEELILRLKGMLRRKMWYKSATDSNPSYIFGENEINFADLSCRSAKREIKLTVREAMVLKYLIEHKGEIVTRKELLEKVWNIHSEVETRTVDNFIARLRKYFEPNPAKPIFIQSIRSAGYMFKD